MQAGIYRHYKGEYYQVLGIGQHTETNEKLVIYISLSRPSKEHPGPRIRCRPKDMFLETVEHEGKEVERFEYIGYEVREGYL